MDPNIFTGFNPLDFFEVIGGMIAGVFIRRKSVGLGIFLQATLIIVKMARHYYNTHPDKLFKFRTIKQKKKLDKIYEEELKTFDLGLKESHETGAAG